MLFCASESLQPLPPASNTHSQLSVFVAESVLSLGFLLKCHVPRGLLVISETICTAISDVINLFTFHISHRNLLIYILIDFHLFPNQIIH